MMKMEYRQDMHHKFMVLSGESSPDMESYPVRMLQENHIAGFLPCHTEWMDGNVMFCYDVTGMQSLRDFLEHKKINRTLMDQLLTSVSAAFRSSAEYLLSPSGVILAPDQVYRDDSGDFLFAYYPGKERGFQEEITAFSEYLLPRLETEDRDAVCLGYSFYQRCAGGEKAEEIFSGLSGEAADVTEEERQREEEREKILDDFFSYDDEKEENLRWEKWKQNGKSVLPLILSAAGILLAGWLFAAGWNPLISGLVAAVSVLLLRKRQRDRKKKKTAEEQMSGTERHSDVLEESQKDLQEYFPKESGGGRSRPAYKERNAWQDKAEERETDGSYGIREPQPEETVYLGTERRDSGEPYFRGKLVCEESAIDQTVLLVRDAYIIGKSDRSADIVLPSAAVSRQQAKIEWNGNEYLLSDLNSKNGTFLNGVPLKSGEEKRLKKEDCITFADLTYRFLP